MSNVERKDIIKYITIVPKTLNNINFLQHICWSSQELYFQYKELLKGF